MKSIFMTFAITMLRQGSDIFAKFLLNSVVPFSISRVHAICKKEEFSEVLESKSFQSNELPLSQFAEDPVFGRSVDLLEGQENSAEGSGEAALMGQGQLCEVHQGQGLYPTLGSPRSHGTSQAWGRVAGKLGRALGVLMDSGWTWAQVGPGEQEAKGT